MPASVSRGQKLCILLACVLIIDRLFHIGYAILYWNEFNSTWKDLILPSFVILSLVWLWEGNQFIRWTAAFWTLMKAYFYTSPIIQILPVLYAATPPEQKSFFWEIIAPAFEFTLFIGVVYLIVSCLLIFSPSLKQFFEYQSVHAEDPFWLLWREFGSLTGLGPKKGSTKDFIERVRNRKRHEKITLTVLKHSDDSDLIDVIHDSVGLQVELAGYDNEVEVFESVPDGCRAVHLYWWLEAEVTNGGFHQFFFNKGIDWALMTLEGLKLLKEEKLAQILARAIDVALREEDEQLEYETDNPLALIENYVQAREQSSLPELDSEFYQLRHGDAAVRFIRDHPEKFVS